MAEAFRCRFHFRSFALLALLAVFAATVLETWHRGYGWHDQQRVYQLVLLAFAGFATLGLSFVRLPVAAQIGLVLVFLVGLVSVFLSAHPLWALKEWGLYVGLVALSLLVAEQKGTSFFPKAVLVLLFVVAFFLVFKFFVYYGMAFLTGVRMLDSSILFSGFSNPRFFNQFQVVAMPLLAYGVLDAYRSNYRYHRLTSGVLFVVLAGFWCMAVLLGARGLSLSLFLAHLVMLLFPLGRQLVIAQLAAVGAGLLLYGLLFTVIPLLADIEPEVKTLLRDGDSRRVAIWGSAWQLFSERIWWGWGPMHFAADAQHLVAHPHQVVLQWLSEWGVIATSLAVCLGVMAMWHGAKYLGRNEEATLLDVALWLSLFAALLLAQVDGVFVMPYTQTWFAIVAGLALGRWCKSGTRKRPVRAIVMLFAVPVAGFFMWILVSEVPSVPQDSEAYVLENHVRLAPRFWLQGWIPMETEH